MLEVLWCLFMTYRTARLWMASILSVFCLMWWSLTVQACFSSGKTKTVYAISFNWVALIFSSHCTKLKVFSALQLQQMFCMCWFQLRSCCKVTSRCVFCHYHHVQLAHEDSPIKHLCRGTLCQSQELHVPFIFLIVFEYGLWNNKLWCSFCSI